MGQSDNNDMFEDDAPASGRTSKGNRNSGGTNWGKVLLILLGIGGVSLAICCGVGYYFFNKAFKMETDPVKIAAMQKEIVEIEIPGHLTPEMGMNMNLGVMTMKMVMYNPNSSNALMLMQMQVTGQTEEQMQQAFRQQAGQQQKNAQFKMDSSETKTVKVDGQDREFTFAKGTLTPPAGTATPVRMITGMFPSKGGMGFIQYSVDETSFDEAAVMKMLESIHK